MFGSPRISTKTLAGLCRRLSTALIAGIDLRTAWVREAERAGNRTLGERLRTVSNAIDRGETIRDALDETEDYFPALFREIVQVGERSGHLGEAFGQLAEHYDGHVKFHSAFLAALVWPMVELSIAIAVVGLLIWAPAALTGQPIDVLGVGLVGSNGLVTYSIIILSLGLLLAVLVRAVRRGAFWTRPIQRAVLHVPGLGKLIWTLALARLAWSLHLTFDAGMDVRPALRLSLTSSQNARYSDQIDAIDTSIIAGDSLYDAFRRTGAFPDDFLDVLAVGEESGLLVESMGKLSRQYRAQADTAMGVLAILAGFAIWALVALLLILLIFRVAMFYIGTIQDAAKF